MALINSIFFYIESFYFYLLLYVRTSEVVHYRRIYIIAIKNYHGGFLTEVLTM